MPLIDIAKRIQLNFHGGKLVAHRWFPVALAAFCAEEPKQFIFQHDGCDGSKLMQQVIATLPRLDCVPFYDTSHGGGILPDRWPRPEYDFIVSNGLQVGFAGGLGPENLAEQIKLIAKAAGKNKFWIDMETRVRSRGRTIQCLSADVRSEYDIFDLEKVRAALDICAPFVGKEI